MNWLGWLLVGSYAAAAILTGFLMGVDQEKKNRQSSYRHDSPAGAALTCMLFAPAVWVFMAHDAYTSHTQGLFAWTVDRMESRNRKAERMAERIAQLEAELELERER